MVKVPECRGRNAGNARKALQAAGLNPIAYAGQPLSAICQFTTPFTAATVAKGSNVRIHAGNPPQLQETTSTKPDPWVSAVQVALTRDGHAVKVDGVFGRLTKLTVETFQRAKGLTVDGVVGPVTWARLGQV